MYNWEGISESHGHKYLGLMLFGAAGLPMFINRSMQGVLKLYPEEFFIPIELSEIESIDRIIENHDWGNTYQRTVESRKIFTIENNITRLDEFLKPLFLEKK